MTTSLISPPQHDHDLQGVIFGDLNGCAVLGMGPDIWELSRQVIPRIGAKGRFVGVHCDRQTVQQARFHADKENGTYDPAITEFHYIDKDLRLSRLKADSLVKDASPTTFEGFQQLQRELASLTADHPLVADESMDLIFATGLSYLESYDARSTMLKEFHRVTRHGGRLVVVDVVSDEAISSGEVLESGDAKSNECGGTLQRDPELVQAVADAGFYGATIVRRDPLPWKTVGRVELRRCAIVAYKGKEGPCWEHYQAVMYRGPFKNVQDDDGHSYPRGEQIAVCQKTFDILSREPYHGQFEYSDPLVPMPANLRKPFPCNLTNPLRAPQQLKFRSITNAKPAQHNGVEAQHARTAVNDEKGKTGKRSKKVVIFVQSAAHAASSSHELASFLQEGAAEQLEIQVVDLTENSSDVAVPAQLRFRMSLAGEECLPAIVVNGVLVALGGLPDKDEAAKLVARGKPFGPLPFTNLKELAAKAGSCCGGSGCCT